MACCGVIRYWCCVKDENLLGPWHDRNNICRIVSGILFLLGVFMALGLVMISPLMYGMGLLTQLITDGSKDMHYEYWMNIGMGWVGFIYLILCLFCLIAVIVGIYFIGYGIYKCVTYCSKIYGEYQEIEDRRNNRNPLCNV